jgi:hypothetical protein
MAYLAPKIMALKQEQGKATLYDKGVDIWALGASMYAFILVNAFIRSISTDHRGSSGLSKVLTVTKRTSSRIPT